MRKSDGRADVGFTLIELLVTITILVVLAAVVVFAVGNVYDRGDDAAEKADRQTLMHAEEAFLAAPAGNGKYAPEDSLTPIFIYEQSTLHDVCLSADKRAYKVVPQAAPGGDSCAGVSVPNP
jgi:prepilin-type N-terminal cleavage/methylation domain-containing protein